MLFCSSFSASVLHPSEGFVSVSKTANLRPQFCVIFSIVSYIYIHSILLIVKLLSASWALVHKILNTVLKFLMYCNCL